MSSDRRRLLRVGHRSITTALAVLAAAIATVACLGFPALASAADPDRAIVVYGPGEQVLTSFSKLNCKVTKRGGTKKLKATGKSPEGWRIDARINDFNGFGQDYPLAYGIRTNNFILYPTSASSPYYANFFFPGDTAPPFGGAIVLSGNGKVMGLGFIAAFSSAGGEDDAVMPVGKASCRYPKKR